MARKKVTRHTVTQTPTPSPAPGLASSPSRLPLSIQRERKTYSEKLRDPRWQRKRLQVFQRDGFCCVFCGAADSELQVHHKVYRRGAQPWEYDDGDLVTLCRDCHDQVTSMKSEIGAELHDHLAFDAFRVVLKLLNSPHWLDSLTVLQILGFCPHFAPQAAGLLESLARGGSK